MSQNPDITVAVNVGVASKTPERPILFSGSMVNAILVGTKTQTRRVVKPQPDNPLDGPGFSPVELNWRWDSQNARTCPYGLQGDHLWVREAWRTDKRYDADPPSSIHDNAPIWYSADADTWTGYGKRRHGMFMPRKFSRITLEITDVRVERLREISEEGAIAEGCEPFELSAEEIADIQISDESPEFKLFWKAMGPGRSSSRQDFERLWDSINGKRPGCAWADNPYVWVVFFRKLEAK